MDSPDDSESQFRQFGRIEADMEKDQEDDCDDECFYLKEELLIYMQEAEQCSTTKTELLRRNKNSASQRPSTTEIAKRDSSVKKNSAFIKKLRNMSAPQIEFIIKECHTLNLSKYLSEAAVAIVEARIKFTDIPSAVLLCTELNCTYADFAGFLQVEYIKVLTITKDEPISNANRLRVELCFYGELSLCGVIPVRQSLPVLGTALTTLTADKTFNTLSLIISFCKHCGRDFAGLVPRRIRLLSEQFSETLKSSTILVASKQENVRNLLHDYYGSLCQHLHNEQEKLTAYEKKNRQILMAKGELRPERITHSEVMRAEIQTLLSGAVTLAELLDVEPPDLPDTDLEELLFGDAEDCNGGHVWEDEETRLFYTQLPDVKEYVAQITSQEEGKEKHWPKFDDICKTDDFESPSKKSALETFLKLLPDCHSKVMVDNAALEFLLYFNSKMGRKKLIITLFTVPKNKLKLLPFYGRFVAILNPVIPELATTLCQQLKSEMMRHIHKKDQVYVESKKKTAKYIGELINFGVYPKKEALKALKLLFHDFTHHNIEIACCLLETCGCILYAASDTHLSTKYYLEQMMRLKTMLALDPRYVSLIENTYYQILPPESVSTTPAPQLTPLQQFIAKIIYQDLTCPGSEMAVLSLLRSLDWNCNTTASYTVMCLTNATNVSYPSIRSLANIVSLLAEYQEDAVCRVIDGVLEDIRQGMEQNEASNNQRRVAMVKYLGELYNYRLIDSSDILRVLYSMISFGVVLEQNIISPLDPCHSVIRIHLVLLLLSTCAFPLTNVETSEKIKYFLIYFQQYYWAKRSLPVWTEERPFPIDIKYRFEDVIYSLSSDCILAENLEEATNTVKNLNQKIFSEFTNNDPNNATFLSTICEEHEFSSDEDTNNNEITKQMPVLKATIQSQSMKNDELDENFVRELNSLISEGTNSSDTNTKPNTDIAVPLNYKKAITDGMPQFALLLKKGNKQICKTLTLPTDHELFVRLKSCVEASRLEKENVKRLTLEKNDYLQ